VSTEPSDSGVLDMVEFTHLDAPKDESHSDESSEIVDTHEGDGDASPEQHWKRREVSVQASRTNTEWEGNVLMHGRKMEGLDRVRTKLEGI